MLAVCGQANTSVSNREDGLRACPLDHRHLEIWISHEKEVSLSDRRHEIEISHEMEVSLSDHRHEIGISHALPLAVAFLERHRHYHRRVTLTHLVVFQC